MLFAAADREEELIQQLKVAVLSGDRELVFEAAKRLVCL